MDLFPPLALDADRIRFYHLGMRIQKGKKKRPKGPPREKFIERRLKLELSQYAVSKAIGMDKAYWRHFERGECIPTLDVAKRIAEFFSSNGIPTHWTEVVDPSLDEQPELALRTG